MNWLTDYLEFTKDTESPRSFHYWTAASIVGAALQRKVWLDMGFKVYPNLFVVLVAPPGRCRKTQAIRYGEDILLQLSPGVSIASDSVTREALIKELTDAQRDFLIGDQDKSEVVSHASLTLISTEFSVFLGQRNYALLALLCELFDCKPTFIYKTKHAGTDQLNGVWFSMLGATTPEWLLSSLPTTAIGGGLTSRILFIVEHNRRGRVTSPKLDWRLKDKLVADLKMINNLEGQASFGEGAYEWFDNWYQTHDEGTDEFSERKHVYILKLSMIIAASHGRKEITLQDLHDALEEIELIESKMPEAFMGVGRSPYAFAVSKILQELNQRGTIALEDFLAKYWNDVTMQEVEEARRVLLTMGAAYDATERDSNGNPTGRVKLTLGSRPRNVVKLSSSAAEEGDG